MRLLSPEQILAMDQWCLKHHPELNLMNHAINKISDLIPKLIPDLIRQKAVVVCGPGNNGKDGQGVGAKLNLEVLSVKQFLQSNKSYDLIVDAIYGVGQRLPLNAETEKAIHKINASNATIIALDVATGCDPLSGVGECFVKAHWTLALGFLKPGYFLNNGPQAFGKIKLLTLPYPEQQISKIKPRYLLATKTWVKKHFVKRTDNSNKTYGGRSIVIAGSRQFPGASVLASDTALRIGAGYLDLFTEVLDSVKNPDFILHDKFKVKLEHLNVSETKNHNKLAVLIGPGVGINSNTSDWLKYLFKNNYQKVVVDADAISVFAKGGMKAQPQWVFTPHSGEMAKLIDRSSQWINENKFQALSEFYQQYKCRCLLKGFHSVYFNGSDYVIIPTGNKALAKSGTGDVLAGMIVGLMSQGQSTDLATISAGFIHGAIADDFVTENHYLTLKASDLPKGLKKFLDSW